MTSLGASWFPTMTNKGPKIANLIPNGILDKYRPVGGDQPVELGVYGPSTRLGWPPGVVRQATMLTVTTRLDWLHRSPRYWCPGLA